MEQEAAGGVVDLLLLVDRGGLRPSVEIGWVPATHARAPADDDRIDLDTCVRSHERVLRELPLARAAVDRARRAEVFGMDTRSTRQVPSGTRALTASRRR